MRLDGNDDAGVFCILLPQKSDKSLKDLQPYRPYEISNGGKGDSFDNQYMLLTLRNSNRGLATLKAVLATIVLDELPTVGHRKLKRQRVDSWGSHVPGKLSKSTEYLSMPLAVDATTGQNESGYNPLISAITEKERRKLTESLLANTNADGLLIKREPAAAATETPQRTPDPQDAHKYMSTSRSNSAPAEIISLELTDFQAACVYIVWTVNADEVDFEFVHTMHECRSFTGLLHLLEEDAEAIPSVANVLAGSERWCMTYQLNDDTRKAAITRRGTETAFVRLQSALAQSSVWIDNPRARIEVQLKALRPINPKAVI